MWCVTLQVGHMCTRWYTYVLIMLQAIIAMLGEKSSQTLQNMSNRVNRWYDIFAIFSVPPFPSLPYAHKGGLLSSGDTVAGGKLQGAEMKRVQGVLAYIADALPGASESVAPLMLARCEQ